MRPKVKHVERFGDACLDLLDSLKFRCLAHSPKKTVLKCSDNRPALRIAAKLKAHGYKVKVNDFVKDLGLGVGTFHKRNARVQAQRHAKAKQRLRRIGQLSKRTRKAHCLVRTGAIPQQQWGKESIGVSPSTARRLRSDLASGIHVAGAHNCSYTTFAVCIGIKFDPWVSGCRGQVAWFLQFWLEADLDLRIQVTNAWTRLKSQLSHDNRWIRVQGLAAATVAVLYAINWKPHAPTLWADQKGPCCGL